MLLMLISTSALFATHNRAGEVTYRRLSGYQFEIKIVTYTKTSSPADRPELDFFWGDGASSTLPRVTIDLNVGPDIQRNVYFGTHTYPGNGTYIMYFLDENRNGGVVNIPGSVNIPFYVETQLIISPAVTVNNSPQLLQPPIDDGAVNRIFIHNPNAFDIDGDSLSYELVPCKGANGAPIPTFFTPPANNSFTLDNITGDLIWDSPLTQGEFNVAMIIREWRNIPGIGLINIGYVTRDMQITIYPPVNDPPVIASILDTCVEAGSIITFGVSATDPNGEIVTLSATGGPFSVPASPATFTSTPGNTATGTLTWNTTCAHVRKNPYTVVFKAEDNNSTIQLVDLESVFITVVGPSPKNPFATPSGNSLVLNWDASACTEAVGYNIYRRVSTYGFIPSHCETGVPAYTGYVLIGSVNGLNTTTFTDDNNGIGLAPAIEYCYMVTAFYPDGAESYASVEFCSKLIRDLPVITNADVVTTDASAGQGYVAWGRPTQLDFNQTPGPFRYVLQREPVTGGGFSDVVTYTNLVDTTYNDNNLNTSATQYRYRVQFWNDTPGNTFQVGTTQTATTIFLSISPGDEKNRLSWNVNVPWINDYYVIYRESAVPGVFDSVDFSTTADYIDDSLVNGINYCYYIKSVGAYPDTGLVNPIINRSQIACAVPVDNEPPCVSALSMVPECEQSVNNLSWNDDSSCAADVEYYSIYYAIPGSSDFTLITTLPAGTDDYQYISPNGIAGCYYYTATDSAGNTSEASAVVCAEPCPNYELPNIFTPDDNGINDVFHPILPYRDVKDIDMQIFNRWGALVFETKDPDINWNGKRMNDGQPCPEGVYYYICIVNELFQDTVKPRVLNGFIHLTRGPKVN